MDTQNMSLKGNLLFNYEAIWSIYGGYQFVKFLVWQLISEFARYTSQAGAELRCPECMDDLPT